MAETPKDKTQEKRDKILRRVLNTPPDPKGKPKNSQSENKKDKLRQLTRLLIG